MKFLPILLISATEDFCSPNLHRISSTLCISGTSVRRVIKSPSFNITAFAAPVGKTAEQTQTIYVSYHFYNSP